MITGDEPINPVHGKNAAGTYFYHSGGLTIRQHFAAMAEIPWDAVINSLNRQGLKDEKITLGMVAELKAKYKVLEADALINELNKPGNESKNP